MIIDTFLFFQELDLLEIRLEYLYPFVDKFIIVESKQSFQGSIKEYVFEKNIKRYKKYMEKIIYYKIEDIHYSYEELIYFLQNSKSQIRHKIASFMHKHNYYDKNNLTYILDTYQRECIHIILNKKCNNQDIIIISDLDEIPAYQIIKNFKTGAKIDKLMVFVQHEFQYFLNNYSNSNWYGSIISPYKLIKENSLNQLRRNSEKLPVISNKGYHFTSVGNKYSIIKKIENWAHQEFNHKIIKDNIEDNLKYGKDIFYRFNRKGNIPLNLKENKIIDKRMKSIILKFDNLILDNIKKNFLFNFKYLFLQIKFLLLRIFKEPKRFIAKLFNFLFIR